MCVKESFCFPLVSNNHPINHRDRQTKSYFLFPSTYVIVSSSEDESDSDMISAIEEDKHIFAMNETDESAPEHLSQSTEIIRQPPTIKTVSQSCHVPTLYCSLQTNHCINFIDDGGEIERHNIVAIN